MEIGSSQIQKLAGLVYSHNFDGKRIHIANCVTDHKKRELL